MKSVSNIQFYSDLSSNQDLKRNKQFLVIRKEKKSRFFKKLSVAILWCMQLGNTYGRLSCTYYKAGCPGHVLPPCLLSVSLLEALEPLSKHVLSVITNVFLVLSVAPFGCVKAWFGVMALV